MSRIVIVLGMHRSGTSCLAGILENAGVNFGEVSRCNIFNPKGNIENRLIMELHDSLLKFNSGSWDFPPPNIIWPVHFKIERDGIIRDFNKSLIWGFKDPRTLLLLDGWLEAVPDANLVATFRHPMSVARSLQIRNNFPLEKGLDLWRIYNNNLLSYSERFDFPIISFDLPARIYKEKIALLVEHIGLTPPDNPSDFFEDTLRNQVPETVNIPQDISRMYEQLQSKSI